MLPVRSKTNEQWHCEAKWAGLLVANKANQGLGLAWLHKVSYSLELAPSRWYGFDKEGSNSELYRWVGADCVERIKVSLAVGWNRWWLTYAWQFTSCFMTDGHLMRPCRGDTGDTVVLCIGSCCVARLALYVGEWTAEQLVLYESVFTHVLEVLYVQAELIADKLMPYECKANCIKPAETWMSGICLLWLVYHLNIALRSVRISALSSLLGAHEYCLMK